MEDRPAGAGYPYGLAATIFLGQVALGIVLFATFQEWVPKELGAGDGWGGYLLAMYGAARFASEGPTGAIADRVERRVGILLGFALMLPAIGLMAAVQNERAFLAFAAQLGFATAFLWPATYAMSADLYPAERRGKVIGFLNLAQLFGFGVGALGGAFLVKGESWWQFAVAGGAVALAFCSALVALPRYRHAALESLAGTDRPRLGSILSSRLVVLAGIVVSASIGLAMVVPAIRPYGENDLDVSFERLTVALIPAIAVGVLCYLPAGHLADRYGRWRPFFGGELLIVSGLLICAATTSLLVAAVGAAILFAGNVLTVPALNAAVMDLAPESHRGTLIGLMVALSGLGLATGPALGGAITAGWGATTTFRVAAVICAGTALAILAYARAYRIELLDQTQPAIDAA